MNRVWFPINHSPIGYKFTYRDFFRVENETLFVRLRLPCGTINEKQSTPAWLDDNFGDELTGCDYGTLNLVAMGLLNDDDIPWTSLQGVSIDDMEITDPTPAC